MTSIEREPADADLLIRPAHQGDAAAVADVYLAARREAPMPPPAQTDDAVRFWLEGKLGGADDTFVAEDPNGVVGYVRLANDWLDDLYVAPALARQGIGSALLDTAKALRPRGFRLWVFASNEPARRFYRRHGLVELEQTDGSANDEGAPDVLAAWPGEQPLAFLRGLVDEVDTELGALLARRTALTAAIQDFKPVRGPAGRDPDRERQIAERLAELVPVLGADRVQRIVHTIITESLDAIG